MTRLRTTDQILGTGVTRVTVPAPDEYVRAWEGFGIRLIGLVDRVRTRNVDDTQHTHYLHGLEHAIARREADVVAGVDHALAELRVRAAELKLRCTENDDGARLDSEPQVADLGGLDAKHRAMWAEQQRTNRTAKRAAAAASSGAKAARVELARVLAEELAVRRKASAVRTLWAEAFSTRAALYQRARHGLFGRHPTPIPEIPAYRPTNGHVDERALDSNQDDPLGLHLDEVDAGDQ
jgi:hypothetical protein